jgi:glutathione S-transferase
MLKFYHAPWSRSSGIFWLMEELEVAYELINIDIRQEGGVPEEYRRIQPNKKVPAIEHDGIVITERPAITIYLADAFPASNLAPAVGDPERGPYLSMVVYIAAVLDPCVTMRANGYEYESNDHASGTFDDMVAYLERILSERPYAAGGRFTAADVLLASSIEYVMNGIHILPERQAFKDYLARIGERPAMIRSREKDAEMARVVPAFRQMFAEAT